MRLKPDASTIFSRLLNPIFVKVRAFAGNRANGSLHQLKIVVVSS
jgi:hypothetical protein